VLCLSTIGADAPLATRDVGRVAAELIQQSHGGTRIAAHGSSNWKDPAGSR
jgi:hypothetical protein